MAYKLLRDLIWVFLLLLSSPLTTWTSASRGAELPCPFTWGRACPVTAEDETFRTNEDFGC